MRTRERPPSALQSTTPCLSGFSGPASTMLLRSSTKEIEKLGFCKICRGVRHAVSAGEPLLLRSVPENEEFLTRPQEHLKPHTKVRAANPHLRQFQLQPPPACLRPDDNVVVRPHSGEKFVAVWPL
jgi:hypothetical protein